MTLALTPWALQALNSLAVISPTLENVVEIDMMGVIIRHCPLLLVVFVLSYLSVT